MQGNQIRPFLSQNLTESCVVMSSNHLSFIILLKLRAQIWVEQHKYVKHNKYFFMTGQFCEK